MSCVLPGVLDTRAAFFLPSSELIALDFPVTSALAGGPVVDNTGEVVGTMLPPTKNQTFGPAPGYAIRIPYVSALLSLHEDESRRRPGHEMNFNDVKPWMKNAIVLITVNR